MRSVIAAMVTVACLGTSVKAQARPPREAKIREGVGMAGVKVGSKATINLDAEPHWIEDGPMKRWGPVDGFCFEGTSC